MSVEVKRVVAGVCAAALAASGALALGGCAADVSTLVDAAGTRADNTIVMSVAADDLEDAVYKAAIENGSSVLEAKMMVGMLPALVERVGNGVHYNAASGGMEASYSLEAVGTLKSKYYKDTVAFYPASLLGLSQVKDASDAVTPEQIAQLEKLLGDKPMSVTWTFDFSGRTPLETNCTAAGDGKYTYKASLSAHDFAALASGEKKVGDIMDEAVYARFTDAALTTSVVETDTKGGYTKSPQVQIYTPGIIAQTTVDAAELGAANVVDLGKEDKHTLSATLTNGNAKTVKVTYDKTKPTVNVKAGKTYKKGVKVIYSDKVAGVKSATLNGKTLKSGKKITKKGSYKVVVTDKAGNAKSVKFKVR